MSELPQFDYEPMPYNGPSSDSILQMRKEFMSPALMTYFKKPLMIVEGKKQVSGYFILYKTCIKLDFKVSL